MKAFDILQQAQRLTGLNDYGQWFNRAGFEALIESVVEHSDLTEPASRAYEQRMIRLLSNLLRMQDDINHYPQILEQEIVHSVWIACLPRTGSTKLHRILAETDQFQTLLFWQGHNPGRIRDHRDNGLAARKKDAKEYLEWLYEAAPEFQIAHPMYYEEVEEELLLQEYSFLSPQPISLSHVPGYLQWLSQQNPGQMYEFLKVTLKYLQWQFGGENPKPWLLKCPTNLGFERFIVEHFPDAKFISTHRDPVKSVPSVCRILETSREMYPSKTQFLESVGQFCLHNFAEAMNRQIGWRNTDTEANGRFLDIAFNEINARPKDAIERTFSFLNLSLDANALQSVENWLNNNQREKHGKNSYSLEHYALTEDMVREQFNDYEKLYSGYW